MAEESDVLAGEVVEALPNAMSRVHLFQEEKDVIVHTAGKLRRPRLRIYLGDKVEVAFSPYDNDLQNGRIVNRLA